MAIELIVDTELRLIEFMPQHAPAIFNLIDRNRAHLSQHGEDVSQKYPNEETVYKSIVYPKDPNSTRFGIWKENTLLGSINITVEGDAAEIGYYLGAEFQGGLVMTRSVKRVVAYGFDELRLDRIYAKVAATNMPSRAVLTRSGFNLDELNERRVVINKGDVLYRVRSNLS